MLQTEQPDKLGRCSRRWPVLTTAECLSLQVCWTGIRHQHSARELWDQAVSTLPGFCSRSSLIKQLVTDPERRLLYALHENNLIQVSSIVPAAMSMIITDTASQPVSWSCIESCKTHQLVTDPERCALGQLGGRWAVFCLLPAAVLKASSHQLSQVCLSGNLLTQCTTDGGDMTESGLPDMQTM